MIRLLTIFPLKFSPLLLNLLLLILVGLVAHPAKAALTDPIPGILGDTAIQEPFGGIGYDPPMRMQQVYESITLEPSLPEGGWITGMWFVSDDRFGSRWTAGLPSVEMTLGLTDRGADELSATFAENFSLTPTLVRPAGPLTITSGGANFAVQINFQNPYFYDPSAGNLLLEIKNFVRPVAPDAGGPLDAWNVTGDSVSRVWARGDANAAVGTVDTIGLTTLFVVTAVPEPSTVALLVLGAGALAWRRLRRGRPRNNP